MWPGPKSRHGQGLWLKCDLVVAVLSEVGASGFAGLQRGLGVHPGAEIVAKTYMSWKRALHPNRCPSQSESTFKDAKNVIRS